MAKPLYRDEFRKLLVRKEHAPVWVLADGVEEDGLEAAERIRERLVAPGFEDFNVVRFSGRETSAGEVVTAARTKAMGPGGRLVVLRDAEAMPREDRERLLEYLENPERDNCLLIILEKFDRQDRLQGKALAAGILVSLKDPPWIKHREVVAEELRALGLRADGDALRILDERLPEDRGCIRRELEKIVIFLGERKSLRGADLEHVVAGRGAEGINRLCDHLRDGDTAAALRVADKLLDEGVFPQVLIGALAGVYRQLLAALDHLRTKRPVKEYRELAGLNDKVLAGVLERAPRHDRERVVQSLLALGESDRLLKSSSAPPATVLEGFLAGRAAGGSERRRR